MKISRKQLRKLIEASMDEIGLLQSIFGNTQDRYVSDAAPDYGAIEARGAWAYGDDSEYDYDGGDYDESEDPEEEPDDLLQEFHHEDHYPKQTTSLDGRMFDYGHSKSDSHEGRMTKAKLFRMAQMAQSLESQLHDCAPLVATRYH